jgi:2-amino-4-hydroxy-6-hydroxymethyldihydropteridine diphosphokinase
MTASFTESHSDPTVQPVPASVVRQVDAADTTLHNPKRAVISLGSNLGNRGDHLDYAIHALERDLSDITVSPPADTAAVEAAAGQPAYLNAALVGLTALAPRALLDRLMEIERERGRERPFPMAPRTLDLDLILYGEEVIEEDGLTVPHPRFRGRAFVLSPLAAIAPEMVDPVSGLTVKELLNVLR